MGAVCVDGRCAVSRALVGSVGRCASGCSGGQQSQTGRHRSFAVTTSPYTALRPVTSSNKFRHAAFAAPLPAQAIARPAPHPARRPVWAYSLRNTHLPPPAPSPLKHTFLHGSAISCFTHPSRPCLKHTFQPQSVILCFTHPSGPCLKHVFLDTGPWPCF